MTNNYLIYEAFKATMQCNLEYSFGLQKKFHISFNGQDDLIVRCTISVEDELEFPGNSRYTTALWSEIVVYPLENLLSS